MERRPRRRRRPVSGGDRISPDDANYDETYDRDFAAMGSTGSARPHRGPAAGHAAQRVRARGGGFFSGAPIGHAMNRAVFSPDFRDGWLGLLVCAPLAAKR